MELRAGNQLTGVLAVSDATDTLLLKATPDDFPYIDALRKREGDSLGFVPKETYLTVLEGRTNRRANHENNALVVTMDNGDYTGFAFIAFNHHLGKASIHQICVQEDARRWHRALLIADWVETEALRRGCEIVRARVAHDIDSNHFWRAAGYEVWSDTTSTFLARTPSKSGRRLLLYVKHLSLPWQEALTLEVS